MNKKEEYETEVLFMRALLCKDAYERCVLLKNAPEKIRGFVLKKLEEHKDLAKSFL